MAMPSNNEIIEQTENWVNKVIVGLGFCPFAKPVVEAETIRYTVVEGFTPKVCLTALLSELERLDSEPELETTLMVFPTGFESFETYLDLVAVAEEFMAEQDYEGIYQLASFHPDYCFDGSKQDDPANFTNRSPYPSLHIIREASIEAVLEPIEHPEEIPERNIQLARDKGLQTMTELLESCKKPVK